MTLPPDLPCVLFALRRESLPFRRVCRPLRRLPPAPGEAFLCGDPPLLLLETGVGADAVDRALAWLFEQVSQPKFVVYAGFAGGLDPGLRVGDVLVADEVHDADGGRWRTTWPGPGSPARRRGCLLTSNQLIASPQEKQRLAARHGAQAVDMESSRLAARCLSRGVPFGCVRAISDTSETALSPALVGLLAGGRVRPLALLAAVVRQPSLLRELARLGRDTRRAAHCLSVRLAELLGTSAVVIMDGLGDLGEPSGHDAANDGVGGAVGAIGVPPKREV